MRICPSIASCDIMNLKQTAKLLEQQFHHIHVDIEDGNYINNITFGMRTLKGIRNAAKCEISVHLMVTDPLAYLSDIASIKPEIVFFHPDACRYPSLVVDEYRKHQIRIGIAFNPACRVKEYEYLKQKQVKDILIMMCEPDGNHQEYIPSMEQKAANCVKNHWITWADGGISDELLPVMEQIGIHSVVQGRAVFEKISQTII